MKDIRKGTKRRKSYVIVRTHKETGVTEGYIENSFSMGWSEDAVKVYWSSTNLKYGRYWSHISEQESKRKEKEYFNKRILKTVLDMRDNNVYEGYEINFYRINSDSCPYSIDWGHGKSLGKYDRRNRPFRLK